MGDSSQRHSDGVLRRYGVIFVWILVLVFFSVLRPATFASASNFATLFSSQAPLGILSLALLIPLVAGDYDLSVASVLTFSGILVAVLNAQHGWPIWLAIAVSVLCGAAFGAINGLICVGVGIDPFIVTLGTGTFINGLTLWISKSTPISGVSSSLVNWIVVKRLAGISYEFFYLIIVAAVLWYLFGYTPLGRRILIVGKGREVARLSGIKVKKIRLVSFIAAGAISALAGIVYVGTSGSADPTAGTTLLLPAFAAVFLGSTTLAPGRFNPWGTLVAVYFLTTGIEGLSLLGVSTFVQQLFYGGALVIAVILSRITKRKKPQNVLAIPVESGLGTAEPVGSA